MANRIADYLTNYKVRLIENLIPPTLTATVEGVAGTTRYEYAATYRTHVGETLPCETVVVTTGNATLSGFNKVLLTTGTIPESALYVRYWKNFYTLITSTVRLSSTPYTEGDYIVLGSNSLVRYECTIAGTSASSLPSDWTTTIGETKVDGGVTWTCRTNKTDSWKLLGEVAASVANLYDTGGSGTTATVPVANTSGRPGVIAIGVRPSTFNQRQTWTDFMGLVSNMVQDLGDLTHKDGDIKEGCSEYNVTGTTWAFTAGKIYLLGRFVDIPSGQITLTGVGEEKVGLTVSQVISTPDDDLVQRCATDEAVLPEYAATGPDWLYFEFAWVKDTDGMIVIKEFVDGVPKTATIDPERTVLDRTLARRTMAVSGSFCVENFPLQVVGHDTDEDKLTLKIGAGYAFPNGFEVRTVGTRTVDFDKARTTKAVNNSGVDVFDIDGAVNEWTYWAANTVYDVGDIVVPSILTGYRMKVTAKDGDFESGATEPTWSETPGAEIVDNDLTWTVLGDDYDLSALDLTVQVGSGNTHTVTFVANNLTAAQVASAIETELNAYPTLGQPDLVNAVSAEAILQLHSADGKSLTLGGTALAQLGWAAGTTEAEGTRIYEINDSYVKTVTDMNYKIEAVVQLTFNATTKWVLVGDNVVSILGASTSADDCYDSKWDWVVNTDWVKGGFDALGNPVSGNAINFSGAGGSEPGAGATFYVKAQMNYNAVKGSRHLCRVIDAKVTKSGDGLPDNLTFTDATSITRLSTGANVTPVGTPIDVVEILRVNNSPGQSTDQYSVYELVKNSGALSHETSYIDWSAASTPGVDQPSNSATYYVSFDFWYHAVEGDYVCADSYDDYPSIELAPNGTWYLRDCVDFRTTGTLPMHGEDPTFDYEFYLGRVDKLTLDDAGNFQLLTGAPAVTPPTPPDQNSTLSIAVLRILPYTYSTADVSCVSVEPLRITQKGIQRLQERIERLEYWQTVNSLESEAEGNVPEGADLQGIFTDALTGFGRMDLQFSKGGVTHTAALDRRERCILLPATADRKLLTVDEANSTHVRRAGNSIMLDYLPEVIINQDKAGIWVNGASDFVYENYYGHMQISPETDVFIDEEQLPQVNIDFDNQFTALIETLNPFLANSIDWSSWSNGVPGQFNNGEFESDEAARAWLNMLRNPSGAITSSRQTTRTGTLYQLVPGAITRETVSGVADFSLQQFMRTKNADGSAFVVSLDVNGLLPNTDHACTINGIPVDLTYDATPVNKAGAQGAHTYSGKTTCLTSNTGSLTATFEMPQGVLSGSSTIRVFYYNNPDISNAWACFYSAGLREQKQDTAIGIPSVTGRVTTLVETGTVQIIEPLAQTFFLNWFDYISAVGLFFKSKSATLGYRVELRNVINGYPGPDVYAVKHLASADIDVSDDATVETVFTFENVLGYRPSEHWCFVGIPDQSNTDYNLWVSELGTVDITTGQRITTQHPNGGNLFHSENNVTWDPWTKRDLKFKIYKSNFENDCQVVFDNLTGVEASRLVMAYDEFIGPATNRRWSYSIDGGATWDGFNPNIDTDLGDVISQIQLRIDVTSDQSSYEIIDQYVGILLLHHDASANYIGTNEFFTDALNYPNKISASMYIDSDSINSGSGTLTKVMATVDDGVTWFVVPVKSGYTAVASAENPYYVYAFETPAQVTITNATNASPIVVTSAGHGFTDNMIVTIASVGGNTNANGDWVVTNADENSFELYTTAGVASSGNSEYTTGGTIDLKEFSQFRGRVNLSTDIRSRTPRVKNISFVTSAV